MAKVSQCSHQNDSISQLQTSSSSSQFTMLRMRRASRTSNSRSMLSTAVVWTSVRAPEMLGDGRGKRHCEAGSSFSLRTYSNLGQILPI